MLQLIEWVPSERPWQVEKDICLGFMSESPSYLALWKTEHQKLLGIYT